MNDLCKISFIFCVNDEDLFTESVRYLNSLAVPDGYHIEILPVTGASSITSGYNFAMNNTDAKYKVYLHQDVFIVNRNFIIDMISIFENHPRVGMLGVIGSKNVPLNAIWWESKQCYGKIIENHTGIMQPLNFGEPQNNYERVMGLDGCILMTQYDVPWREDLFDGWHFYDMSHCAEMKRAGYEVGIPKQQEPWVVHDCGIVNVRNGYETHRNKYLKEYYTEVFPKVSVLIPTYKRPEYLIQALMSAINQTYPNVEIIVSDDDIADESYLAIKPIMEQNSNIRYVKNELEKWTGNFKHAYNISTGDIIAFLADDDLFHSQKLEKMVSYLIDYPNVKLVTSYRSVIDGKGNFCNDIQATQKLFEKDTIVKGIEIGNLVLSHCVNYIGEVSTAIFRKIDLKEEICTYRGKKSIMGDISTWLSLIRVGDVAYISDCLNYFRIHNQQVGQNNKILIPAINDWYELIHSAKEDGYLQDEYTYKLAMVNYLKQSFNYLLMIEESQDFKIGSGILHSAISDFFACHKEQVHS